MPVSTELLNTQLAVLRLKNLSDKMVAVTECIASIEELSTSNILTTVETQALAYDFKNNIKAAISLELGLILGEATAHGLTSELEVNNKIKNLTVTIAGSPVILPPPESYAISELQTLGLLSDIAHDLTQIIDNFNTILG